MKNYSRYLLIFVLFAAVAAGAACFVTTKTPSNNLYFRGWHPETGMVLGDNEATSTYFRLDAPQGKLVFDKKLADIPDEKSLYNPHEAVSRSGKFTVKTEIGQRNTDCCAVLTGENRVILFETANPQNVEILADGREADWSIYGWTKDDKAILFFNDAQLFLINAATKQRQEIQNRTTSSQISQIAPTPNGAGVFYFENDSQHVVLVYLDLNSLEKTNVLQFSSENRAADTTQSFSPDSKTLALAVNRQHENQAERENTLFLFDTGTRQKTGEYKLPNGEMTTFHWRSDNAQIGFGVRTAKDSNAIYSIKTTGELTTWFKSASSQ